MPLPPALFCSCLCLILLFVSVCLCSSELRSLHHWRWKRYFNRCIKVLGEGVCRSVFSWLPKGDCAAAIQGLCVFPMGPFHCLCAREHLLTAGPFHMPVPWLLASGSDNAGRKMVDVTWLSLFVCALKKQNQSVYCCDSSCESHLVNPFCTDTELVIDSVGSVRESRGTAFCMLTFFSDNTEPNTSSHINAAPHSAGTECYLSLTHNWSAHSL